MTALVAEAGDQLKVTAEGFRVPGQAANHGAPGLAVLDLADPGRDNAHLLGHPPLGEVPGLAKLGQLVCADLGAELTLSGRRRRQRNRKNPALLP